MRIVRPRGGRARLVLGSNRAERSAACHDPGSREGAMPPRTSPHHGDPEIEPSEGKTVGRGALKHPRDHLPNDRNDSPRGLWTRGSALGEPLAADLDGSGPPSTLSIAVFRSLDRSPEGREVYQHFGRQPDQGRRMKGTPTVHHPGRVVWGSLATIHIIFSKERPTRGRTLDLLWLTKRSATSPEHSEPIEARFLSRVK